MHKDMELFIFFLSICLCLLLKPLLSLLLPSSKSTTKHLPPGPSRIAFLASFVFLRKSFFEFGPIISNLRRKYGPLITVHLGSSPTIFITNNTLVHQALVLNGATFADRPKSIHNLTASHSWKIISNSPYGSTWRALRRNLTGGVLHPSQLKSFSHARKRVLDNLIAGLEHDSKDNKAIYVAEHFRYAIFSLLVLLCFGDNIDDNQMKEIEVAQKESFLSYQRMKLFFIMPKLGKFFFRKLWNELNNAMINCNNVFLFMVRSRKQEISARKNQESLSYVDTLLDFQLPGEEGTLAENHIVGLCSEFITAGTDSTTSALQWIMACIVKYPSVQAKVYEEMKAVLGQENQWVQEDDLQKMPYLRAVILEGLRRHPPGYAPATPHAVTEDVELGGYTLPKGTAVNFLIPDIGRDPNVWEHPLEFKPERFLKSDDTSEDDSFDITGKGEIKMMPFGAGRRICPGNGVAMLHLTYIVANLVWHFEWSPPDGEEVDLTEKYEITISMKRALKACLSPRFK